MTRIARRWWGVRLDWTAWFAVLALGLAGMVLAIAVMSYRRERAALVSRREVVMPAAAAGIAGLSEIAFPVPRGAVIRGWRAPSHNGAAVILTHGSGATRVQVLPQARLLAARGFGLLLFDWPGHGESSGEASWGEAPGVVLRAALDLASAEPDVAPRRIGAFGFSMGGYFLARFAPEEPGILALAIEAVPGSAEQQTRHEYRRFSWLSERPALCALREAGWRPDERRPIDRLPRLAPRGLLVIAGTADRAVPLAMARELFAVAGEPKQLWEVEGADHGGCYRVAPGEYERRLVGFFERFLLAPREAE